MWSKLEEVFENLDLPYYRQGSLAEDAEVPAEYYTFWNSETKDMSFYDNESRRVEWTWEVWSYTDSASRIYEVMNDFIAEAKLSGFILKDRGRDVSTGENGSFGRYIQIKYSEILED